MAATKSKLICNLEGCEYAETGVCREGFEDPNECPNVTFDNIPADEEDETSDSEALSQTDEVAHIAVPSGEAMTIGECRRVLAADPTTMILVAGTHGSGKTTLLTTLYQQFLCGPFAGASFAGSETLLGFEQRCFLGRVESGGAKADTERTRVEANDVVLHIRYVTQFLHYPRSILLFDMSGETFRSMRQSNEELRKRGWLRRVDRLSCTVDMEQFIEPRTRHATRQEVVNLVRGLVETEMLRDGATVDLVATKWDHLSPDCEADAELFLSDLATGLQEIMSIYAQPITRHNTAARPKRGAGLPVAYGMSNLFERWTAPAAVPIRQRTYDPELRDRSSAFDWLAYQPD